MSRCDTGKVSGILRGHEGIVNHLLPLSKSGLVISASGDMSIKLWNVDLMECVDTMYGHSRRIVKLSVTSDEKYCISADDQNLILWNLWYRSNIISIPFACSRI